MLEWYISSKDVAMSRNLAPIKIYLLANEYSRIGTHLKKLQRRMLKYARESFAVQFPSFDIVSSYENASHPYTFSSIVECAIQTMHHDLPDIPNDILLELCDAYNQIPKSHLDKDTGQYVSINETSVQIQAEMLEKMTAIAKYMKKKRAQVPYMIKAGVAAPKPMATIAVLYTAKYGLLKDRGK